MDEAIALHRIAQLVQARTGQTLSPLQRKILQSSWRGQTYEEMPGIWSQEGAFRVDFAATSLRDEGSKLWALLSELLGIPIRKTRLMRETLVEGLQRLEAGERPPSPASPAIAPELHFQDQECGEVRWVGRSPLLTTLRQQLQADCRILSLVGLTGIGKTTLALRLMQDKDLWPEGTWGQKVTLSRQSPNFDTLVQELLPEQNLSSSQQDPEQWLRMVLHALSTRPHLLVLDMVEEIMAPDEQGQFRFCDRLYEEFLQRVASAKAMPSRIVLTSQDQPPLCLEGRYPDRWFQQAVKGLTLEESLQLFQQWEISPEGAARESLESIVQLYEGHPLALRMVISDLRSTYEGDVSWFWEEHGAEITAMLQARETDQQLPSPLHRPHRLVQAVRDRIEKTFRRLQHDHPIAFELICQGSIFYKPAEKERWLRRIRQYSPDQQKLAFATLQQRFLLEEDRIQRPYRYRLHSLIQSVAAAERSKLEEQW